MQTIDGKRLADQQGRSAVDVIDVRMPTKFRQIHAECARNIPLNSLDPRAVVASRNGFGAEPLYVNRSAQACKKFFGAGLMFAGATGFCPLSSTIAKMAWNQCDDGGCGGSCSA